VGNSKNDMKKLIFILSLIILPISSFGQINEKQFFENIEWLNQNPSESNNQLFVSKSADLITFQIFNYPNFYINVSGTKELDKEWKNHKYEKYFIIVYSYNQLYYKLNNKKFKNLDSYVFSIKKLIESYSRIIEKEPKLKIKIFDEYKSLTEKELRKRIKKVL